MPLVASYGVWLRSGAKADRAGERSASNAVDPHTLGELCKEQFESGWKVKHPPDLPGPYRRCLPGWFYYHSEAGGSTVRLRESSGAVVWEERTRPGVMFLTLKLETTDGRLAHGLLAKEE